MAGFDFRYKKNTWTWQGEMSAINIAGLKMNLWQSVVGFDINPKNSLYLQYGETDYKIEDKIPAATLRTKSGAWDKDQLALSYRYRFNKKASVAAEYEINDEKVPAGTTDNAGNAISSIDNNLFFLEYMVSF